MIYNKKRKLNKLKVSLLLLMMVCFAGAAQAQVYMRNGSSYVGTSGVKFYDSGGKATGPEYYWNHWFGRNQDFTYTFRPEGAEAIQVDFEAFTAYTDNNGFNDAHAIHAPNGDPLTFSLRLNDAELYVYEGEDVVDNKLITMLTGAIINPFTIMSNGPITFRFKSYSYREEGWGATVKAIPAADYKVQKPAISLETCSDMVVLNHTTLGSEIHYTVDGTNPSASSTLYEGPFDITVGSSGTTVKAISVLGSTSTLEPVDKTFTTADLTPVPDEDQMTIVRNGNTLIFTLPVIPDHINETYGIIYTDAHDVDPADPDYVGFNNPNNSGAYVAADGAQGVMPGKVHFEWIRPNTNFKFRVVAQTCAKQSEVVSYQFGNLKVLDPVITLVDDDATITWESGYVIRYTTDGTIPSTTIGTEVSTGSSVAVNDLDPGTTLKAIAYKTGEGAGDYDPSNVVSVLYLPNGGQSGTSGDNLVILNDLEPHTWSYYSDPTNPVRSLKPVDVKITYKGNGTSGTGGNMTSSSENGANPTSFSEYASGVRVGVASHETQNEFLYLKTLERADGNNGTGRCEYTAIPNPFSVRPTGTGNGNAKYRGFYRWRLKSIAGGSVYTVATGGTALNVNATVEAEAKLYFEPAEGAGPDDMIEVVFEALWAQAYVNTSNSTNGLNGGSYERNFIVGATPSPLSVPVTYSRYYPDGTGGTNTVNIGSFTCSADTKFEYMNLNNGTLIANNHYLCMGRGLTGTASNLEGIKQYINNNTNYSDLNYTLRVESGTYTKLSFVRDGNATVTGRVQVKAIMGCDYDRVDDPSNNPNARLVVSNNGTLYYARRVVFNSRVNKDAQTFECVIKSGQYQGSQWNGTDANSDHNFYCGTNNGGGSNYPGIRYVTIEGGELASMNGGRGTDDNSTNNGNNHASTNVVNFNARIKGGIFYGSVFGGASDNHSNGSKKIVVTGGTVKGWIAGGANGTGTGTAGSMAATLGDSYVYVGGDALIGNTDTGVQTVIVNETVGGQVFGAGRGKTNNGTSQTASVYNSYVVIADNATISSAGNANGGNVYGGGNLGVVEETANVYILGGTVQHHVFGGAIGNGVTRAIPTSNVYFKGGAVNGNVYGGSNSSGTVTNSYVTMSGGETTNVFGGGFGKDTNIGESTTVNVDGGNINNVYGGGEEGTVEGNTNVNISGGAMQNVFGAGKGKTTGSKAEISGSTNVNVTGGSIVNVYGGGENGDIVAEAAALKSTVTINGGNILKDVYGGGAYGTTAGNVVVNMKGGNVHGSVYGGALGEQHRVYVAGTHTVNVLGGHVFANVYGGSRNADDALSFTPGIFSHEDDNHNVIIDATNDETVCVVNISGGQVDQQVYAAGFFGNCYGSVFAFVGKDAIYNAPNHIEEAGSESAGEAYEIKKLYIVGSVWAGGDWGTFTDHFGAPTISGKSNVYVDGQDYITNTSDKNTVGYMCIEGSLFGSGTSCDAGNKEHTVMLRNYGESVYPYAAATRDLSSIQRADYLVLDNVHVDFQGQGRINSLNVTELYAIYEVSEAVLVTNGSTLIMDAPTDQVKTFWSTSCNDVYTATLPVTDGSYNAGDYDVLSPGDLTSTDNKVRVNGGNYIKIYHDKQIHNNDGTFTAGYGMLNGYAYMMASNEDTEATCAYARPRWCANDDALFHINDANYDNRNDGGWVSYVSSDNKFDLDGDAGNVQMEYENHTPDPNSKVGETYFRIWRTTGTIHEREGVFDVMAYGEDVFKYVDVEIELPAWRGNGYYYAFQTVGEAPALSTTTDYGTELMTFNAALYDDNSWIYYDIQGELESGGSLKAQKFGPNTTAQDEIKAMPDVNYGLVILPGAGNELSSPQIGGVDAPALIINNDADGFLAQVDRQSNSDPWTTVNRFDYTENEVMPTVIFRLTYSDLLSSNKTYEPIWVNLVQCGPDGNVTDVVKVKLIVNTTTVVGRNFTADVYAVMNGTGSTAEDAHVQVVLPRFTLATPGKNSTFTVTSIDWNPNEEIDEPGVLVSEGSGSFTKTDFAMRFGATSNYDGTTGWNELVPAHFDTEEVYDGQPSSVPVEVGTTGGRSQFSFDFKLTYNGNVNIGNLAKPELMGTLVYHMKFTNYAEGLGDDNAKDFLVTINVYRRGEGTRYYLDGINGRNSYIGTRPDQAMLTLSAIFNRTPYLPGDEIYVVNQVTADPKLEWNGLVKGGNVKIYRYNGGHELFDDEVGIIGNSANAAYTGALVNVPNGADMIIRGITLDGYYNNGGDETEYSTVAAAAPLITVANGGTLELQQNVTLQQNYNNATDGGAVAVAAGGTLMMNNNANITGNKTDNNGGGVFMDGTMIASGQTNVWNNMSGGKQNNVYLAGVDRKLQIGVQDSDIYKDLDYVAGTPAESAKIGLSKPIDYFNNGIAEVVYSEETDWLEEPLNTQAIIVHDGSIYRLEIGADPNILYWIDTWVTWVTSQPEGFNINNIDSEEDLAWVISLVNGENGQTPHSFAGERIILKKDLDMKDHTWVPIGEDGDVFKGIFEGNGHVVEGLISSLTRSNLGMFGITDGATIQDVVAKANFNGVSNNVGTIIGTMKGGTLTNVEAAGTLTGDDTYTKTIGGLVGEAQAGSTIHSAFAVNTITAQRAETMVGGLVADNSADLYNSYSNVTATGLTDTKIGGLVGVNKGHVENCYAVVGSQTFPAFANINNGEITICYADKDNGYVKTTGDGATLTKHGKYAAVKGRKDIGYMYDDNAVDAENEYVVSEILYTEGEGEDEVKVGHITKWPGLLSTLNQWVVNKSDDDVTYTPWFRPTSNDINGDLPVLGFPNDNSLATTDGKFLHYGSIYNNDNGLDNLFTKFENKGAKMFLYGNATNVMLGSSDNVVFINEDAVLLQKPAETMPAINAVVGVTFDNSSKQAVATNSGAILEYDWHFMSSALKDAPINPEFNGPQGGYLGNANITSMDDECYFPNGLIGQSSVKWDFYAYSEKQYHWINLKRDDHYYQNTGDTLQYANEDQFIPGKGYMMAISKDSYMSSTGTLNTGGEEVVLTNQEDLGDRVYNKGWNLVGNPYQAYLDLSKIPNREGGFYIFDADQKVYAPVVAGQSQNESIPSTVIHPHQAFFMHTSEKSETFTFSYDWATDEKDEDGASYYRGGDRVNYPLVNLFAENERGNRDMVVVELNRPELGGATKANGLRNANFQIAASLQGHRYSLLFTPENTDKVPVHFTTEENGTFTLTWNTQNGNFTSLLLVDNKTGNITDMLTSDHYTFNASTNDYASRFYLTYACTGVEENNDGDGSFVFFDGSQWVVDGQGFMDVVDMLGRTVYTERLVNEHNRVNLNGVVPGVYLMRVSDGKNTMVQKIVVR